MTIVKPNHYKKNSTWKLVFSLAGVTLVATIIVSGVMYSRMVGLQHEILSLEETIKAERTTSAELQNTLFTMTDPQRIDIIAAEKGLVEEKNPKWVFASF